MTQRNRQRAPGAPTSAIPALLGYALVTLIGPLLYAGFLCTAFGKADMSWLNAYFAGAIMWVIANVWLVLYPATRGAILPLRVLNVLAIAGILALVLAIAGDVVFYFRAPASERGTAIFLFWMPLAPLLAGAWFLADGLAHQPWFNPAATPAQIGPSRGTAAELETQAQRADTRGTPGPRWLCYACPPFAALRMNAWWQAAASVLICVAALALLPFIPARAIFAYAFMGTFADRTRAMLLRKTQ